MPSVGSESTSTRSMPSGTLSVGVRIRPNTMALVLRPKGRPSTQRARGTLASGSRSYSENTPIGSPASRLGAPPFARPLPVSMRTIS